jgi:hypothetical protein
VAVRDVPLSLYFELRDAVEVSVKLQLPTIPHRFDLLRSSTYSKAHHGCAPDEIKNIGDSPVECKLVLKVALQEV